MKTVTQTMLYRQALINYASKYGVTKAAIRYKTNRQYIYRWIKRYDGTLESLADKSHRPHQHPNQHTEEEKKLIMDMRKRNMNELSREDAIIAMVDSNLHRDGLLPSEKARAYRMKNDVLKHQGKRTDLTSRQNGEKLTEELTITRIANIVNDSERTIRRYIRLTYLIPELLDMVDEKKIAITPAVEISYLTEELQKELLLTIDCEQAVPSLSQAQQMRKANERGELDGDMIFKIMVQRKANQAEPLKISQDILKKYFSPDATPKHMVEVIEKALDYYASHLHQIKRSRDAR